MVSTNKSRVLFVIKFLCFEKWRQKHLPRLFLTKITHLIEWILLLKLFFRRPQVLHGSHTNSISLNNLFALIIRWEIGVFIRFGNYLYLTKKKVFTSFNLVFFLAELPFVFGIIPTFFALGSFEPLFAQTLIFKSWSEPGRLFVHLSVEGRELIV